MTKEKELDTRGIMWMGAIPDTWERSAIKRYYRVQLGKMLQNEPLSKNDVLVPYLKAMNVLWQKVEVDDLPKMWASPTDLDQYGVREGDLLVCEGGEGGRAGILQSNINDCIVQNALHRVRPSKSASVEFLLYILQAISSSGWFDILCNRATIMHFTKEKFADLYIPYPALDQQQIIVNFLKHKISPIDKLITKKQRQIELLQEKRSALISHIITKGLDPNVKMKDSCTGWFGDIPEHWQMKKLKFLLAADGYKAGPFGSSLITSQLSYSGKIKVYSPEHIALNNFEIENDLFLPEDRKEEMSQFFIKPNDIIFPIVGTLGRAMIFTEKAVPGILNQRLARIRLNNKETSPKYIQMLMSEVDLYKQLDNIESKGAILEHITKDKIMNRLIPLPPIREQWDIISFIDKISYKIDDLIEKVGQSIQTLQEYRTALISAAVTGKINVRQEVT